MNSSGTALAALLLSTVTLWVYGEATAATLDADAVKPLVMDRMWQQPQAHGSGQLYWSWKSDGTVCLRTEDKVSECADTGRWTLGGNRMCYELTWWGASSGRKSACFRIDDQGNGRYEAIQDNGLSLFQFSVLE